jgi:hypothetical protein
MDDSDLIPIFDANGNVIHSPFHSHSIHVEVNQANHTNTTVGIDNISDENSHSDTAPVIARPEITDDDLFYDLDRQMLLPANLSTIARPGIGLDVHFPKLTTSLFVIAGVICGLYIDTSSSLGFIVLLTFSGKHAFQYLYNRKAKTTVGLSTNAVYMQSLSANCFSIFTIATYSLGGSSSSLDAQVFR